ncbi:energy transducer TonB [Pseudodesulfovibrio sediminis]|uniref:TonB C-terminal domain-containing protein n=1 Tax=Pseudodesulfovibrio sediminis TaxID=2810563 RepID=A0ABN6ESP1_9BACT|nr:energy transducer TonB [Pseudodesulfovibrio sediminis]BCS88146.1 hypothetical protein PSDVSF_13880 [Pseudodesulfovibrio sediminis]
MTLQAIQRHLASGTAALGVTLFLFMLPLLMSGLKDAPPPSLEHGAIRLSSTPSPKPPSEQDNQETFEQSPPEPLKNFAPPTQDMQITPEAPAANIDLPDAQFSINPQLATDMNLPAPASVLGMSAPATLSGGGSLKIGELDNTPALLFSPSPQYPHEARRRHIETTITAELYVDKNGNVTLVKIIKNEHSHLFEATVRKALLRWRFKPGTKDGSAVKWTARVPIKFNER